MLRGILEAVSQQLFFSPRKNALAPFDEPRRTESVFLFRVRVEDLAELELKT
jgi:hypothetical protein